MSSESIRIRASLLALVVAWTCTCVASCGLLDDSAEPFDSGDTAATSQENDASGGTGGAVASDGTTAGAGPSTAGDGAKASVQDAGPVRQFESPMASGCVPLCAGRECGPDPACGESCGQCRYGAPCSDGRCDIACRDIDDSCEESLDCCGYEDGTALCFRGSCRPTCTDDPAGCSTGCCIALDAERALCIDAGGPGSACDNAGQCCSFWSDEGTCISQPEGGGLCQNFCTRDIECPGGCCLGLQNGGAACAPSQFCL
ncbi:MAG: hypothetical protein OEZ06_04930 [Myxococcales bacterium]|nr:hypothetical protein [Myxococcales bacterium]